MNPVAFSSPDYATARQRFRDAAQLAGERLWQHSIGTAGHRRLRECFHESFDATLLPIGSQERTDQRQKRLLSNPFRWPMSGQECDRSQFSDPLAKVFDRNVRRLIELLPDNRFPPFVLSGWDDGLASGATELQKAGSAQVHELFRCTVRG
jgi:hypothetical protein